MVRPKREKLNEVGRPQKMIDWDWVDKQLIYGCTGTEVAAGLGMHPNTLYERTIREKGVNFSEYSTVKDEQGKSILRAKQFESAYKGNTTMQIWLGKQRLRQKEHHDQSSTPNDEKINTLLSDVKAMKDRIENAPQPKADQSDQRSESPVQHMGGSGEQRQDLFEHNQTPGRDQERPEGGRDDRGSEQREHPEKYSW